jgi:hypothetical protein
VSRELDEHASVDRVVLGEDAQAQREVANVAGIDDGDGQRGVEQRVDQPPLDAAGGLDDDQRGPQRPEQLDDLRDAPVIVGDGEDLAGIGSCQVELVACDVDSDEHGGTRRGGGL